MAWSALRRLNHAKDVSLKEDHDRFLCRIPALTRGEAVTFTRSFISLPRCDQPINGKGKVKISFRPSHQPIEIPLKILYGRKIAVNPTKSVLPLSRFGTSFIGENG